MLTRILNALGIETKAQRQERERRAALRAAQIRHRDRIVARRRSARGVITTNDVPVRGGKRPQDTRPPSKPTQQVRAERYGYDDYMTPGFNGYYAPTFDSSNDSSSYGSSCSDSSTSSSFDSGSSSFSCD